MTEVRILEGSENMDWVRVQSWLTGSYWSPGIDIDSVKRAARHSSLVIGAFGDAGQIGYCRVVSDRVRFAYLCDVFVSEEARGKGVATQMVRFALEHPEHQPMRRWLLATADAHKVYEGLGFEPLPQPDRWMVKIDPELRNGL